MKDANKGSYVCLLSSCLVCVSWGLDFTKNANWKPEALKLLNFVRYK